MPNARLDRLLANMGYGSRKDIASMASAGWLTLDGVPIKDVGARIALTPDLPGRFLIKGRRLDPLPGVVLMLHKPLGVTCSHKEAGALVYDLLPTRWRARDPAISSVGRLDKETTGLLLLTDDGDLLHRIISPKRHVEKRYQVTLARPLRGDEGAIFASGTLMLEGEDKPLVAAGFEAKSELTASVTVTEGRYHQVRRMFAAVGNHVVALHRDRVGQLELPENLAPGAFVVLGPDDIARVFDTSARLVSLETRLRTNSMI
jgi:16S rRNA pseudouridine516 synthase